VNGILLRALPYQDADRLVASTPRTFPGSLPARTSAGWSTWSGEIRTRRWRAWSLDLDLRAFSGDADAERIDGAEVTTDLFPLLGVSPVFGRNFTAEEGVEGKDQVVLLGYDLWQRRFGGDRGIVNRPVTIDGKPYTVIGVMPRGFAFPERGQVWMPYTPDESAKTSGNRFLAGAIGRMKPGVQVPQVQADLDAVSMRLEQDDRQANLDWRPR
jgi:hypothetical protein